MSVVTVEEVVSKYVLDPSAYQRGANAVIQASKSVAEATGGAMRTVGRNMRGTISGLGVGVAGFGVGIGLIAKNAIDSALAFDTMERSLRAVTGSAARAKAVLGFVDKLAIPSIFTSAELAESAKTLEAFGLATERFLPIAEKLGTVFGGTSADLRQFVDSLGMIKGGRFGEAFESLARAGISRDSLKSKGLQFDKGGSFTGDINQALNAVEQVVNERFGKLSQEMASGPAAKMASVMDAWERASRKAGAAMLEVLVPVAEKLGNALQNLVDKGYIDKIAKGFSDLFNAKDLGDGLTRALAGVIVLLEGMPDAIRGMAKYFGDVMRDMRTHIIQLGAVTAAIFLTGPLLQGITITIEAFGKLRKALQSVALMEVVVQAIGGGVAGIAKAVGVALAALSAAAGVAYALDKMLPTVGSSMPQLPGMADFNARVNKVLKDLSGEPSTDAGSGNSSAAAVNLNAALSQIAQNTAATAQNTQKMADINDRVLGGGTIGGRGLSRQDLRDLHTGTGPKSEVHKAVDNLANVILSTMTKTAMSNIGKQTTRREV